MNDTKPHGSEKHDAVELEPHRVEQALAALRDEQNPGIGVVAGALAALVGAGLWAAVTVMTGYQIGWMAIGVGVLIGLALRKAGKGIDRTFGFAGAGLALAGCLLGNLLAVCGFVSVQQSIPLLQVLGRMNPAVAVELLRATFSPIDLLFYALAVYEGYKLSFRQVTREELSRHIPEMRDRIAA